MSTSQLDAYALSSSNFPLFFLISSALIAVLVLLIVIREIDWQRLKQYPFTGGVFILWVLALSGFALLRANVLPGLALHLIGLTAATLMMGWRLAYIAAILTQGLLCWWGVEPLLLLGLNILIKGLLPVGITTIVARFVRYISPNRLFMFTLGSGFLGGVITMMLVMFAQTLVYLLFSIYNFATIFDNYLLALPIVIYSEGFINGVIITALVAFHPNIISAFDPDRYFS